MDAAVVSPSFHRTIAGYGALAERLRVLYIATPERCGGWLAEALAADSALHVLVDEADGVADGMARLRDEAFDAVLVSHDPPALDALDLVEGLRAAGADEPIVILGQASEAELTPLSYEVGADAYISIPTATTRLLIWSMAQAVRRAQLERENRRYAQTEQNRLRQEHDEAERLLTEQRSMLGELESMYNRQATAGEPMTVAEAYHLEAQARAAERTAPPAVDLPEPLVALYRELLRTYVIMGSGNLLAEMSTLGDLLVQAGVTARQTLQLHLQALAELVRGLGARSARHVMTRGELLVLEVLVHLGEGYRQRYTERRTPAIQRLLPGMEEFVDLRGPSASVGAEAVGLVAPGPTSLFR